MDFALNTTFKDHEEYLTKRGIDPWTREKLQIDSVGVTRLIQEGFKFPEKWNVQSALLIPANKPDGTVGAYGARLFYSKTFGEDSRAKYISLPGDQKLPPSIHFSPLANWDRLEYGQRVFICESYTKANLLCKLGYHAIGISGCNGWAYQQKLNYNISNFDWRGRGLQPVIFMDSNVVEERPDLWGAAKRLQAAMDVICGVETYLLRLPPKDEVDGTAIHWGLDDYYMEHGEEGLRLLTEGEVELLPGELDAHLVQMNSEVCVIRDVGRFADIDRNILMARSQFEDVNYADRKAMGLEGKKVNVAKVWTTWDKRSVVDTMKYKPGMSRLEYPSEPTGSQSYFNLWRGWGCEPLAGDATFFTDWVEQAFPEKVERDFFLDWWAYQVQSPGVKLNTALMLVGSSGVGKGWMASIAERIFGGDNTWKCNLSDLESRFNSGLGAAQLLVIEEADVSGGVKVYNVLKDLITNEHLRYERKGVDAVKLDNVVNIFLNSNHIDVLQLDEFDRRFAVLEIPGGFPHANDLDYWEPRWEWLRSGGGASIVFGWLLRRDVEANGFSPHGEAPWTQAKKDMVELTHDPIDSWVKEYVTDGEQITVGGSDVDGRIMTAKELAWCYYEGRVPMDDITKSMATKMNKALKNARTQVASAGKKIKFLGNSSRFFLLSGPEYSENWAAEADNRLFFRSLVASAQGQVASPQSSGNLESDKKW